MTHDYVHGLARCSCGRIGLMHWPWEGSTNYPPRRPTTTTSGD